MSIIAFLCDDLEDKHHIGAEWEDGNRASKRRWRVECKGLASGTFLQGRVGKTG